MDYEQGRINNYDWNEPVSKHLEIAYEALQRCITDNFSPFPTCNPKMTVSRHRKTDRRPAAFINKDNESIGLGLAGGDVYWTDGSMSLTDLVNMWNKAQDAEEKHDDEDEEATAIAGYDWDEPIEYHPKLACKALQECVKANFRKELGVKPPRMTIHGMPGATKEPDVSYDEENERVGLGDEDSCLFWNEENESLHEFVARWNKAQGKYVTADEFGWNRQIGEDIDAATAALTDYVKKSWMGKGDPKKPVRLCWKCGAVPSVFTAENGPIMFFGCQREGHKRVYIGSLCSLDGILEEWNEAQEAEEKRLRANGAGSSSASGPSVITPDMIAGYDWDAEIDPDDKDGVMVAAAALEDCIDKQWQTDDDPKMTVRSCRLCGRLPTVKHYQNCTILECSNMTHGGRQYIGDNLHTSLAKIVDNWNKAQETEKKDEKKDGSWSPLGLREEMPSFAGKSLPECADMACDAMKKELRSITENVGRRLLAPEHILSKIDSVEYIKARIDRRIATVKDDGLREDYLMWLAEDIILLVIAMRKKEAGEAE